MKKIAIYIMRIGLNFIYAVLKFFPTQKNKVLFLSRQSNMLTLDFKMTQEELEARAAGHQNRYDLSQARRRGQWCRRIRKVDPEKHVSFGDFFGVRS